GSSGTGWTEPEPSKAHGILESHPHTSGIPTSTRAWWCLRASELSRTISWSRFGAEVSALLL
ncbi:hypothetical protein, partial [Microcoleus sp. OTE_8_concoct_300]|uniref:hypothetical protein n=1 Tax=Microcoleus sp. OTE_8_concoct_300 TaxID=2964710 RepID=UPI00403F5886